MKDRKPHLEFLLESLDKQIGSMDYILANRKEDEHSLIMENQTLIMQALRILLCPKNPYGED